jgi:Site-specific recombinase XerD
MTGTIIKTKLKRGRISWGYAFDAGRDQNGKRQKKVRKGFATKHEAADALREALGGYEKDGDIEKDPRTFEAFFKTWLEQHGAAHWGKMTAEQNNKRAAYAIKLFGDVPVQKLTSMRLEQSFGTLLARGGTKTAKHPEGRPLSPKTVNAIAALVAQALDKAVKWKMIQHNPMNDFERATAHKKEVQLIEPDEYEKYLNRVQGTRYYALSVFAAASGCRRAELLALKWPDIDPKSGVVTISKSVAKTKTGLEIKSPKNGKTRFVRISVATLQVLLEHKAQIEQEKLLFGSDYKRNNLVFPTPDGDYYNPDSVTGRIREFMQEAGVRASLHSLRHFSASMMLSQHVPITVVSKRLGHANSQITLNVYSHAMKNDELTAAKLWDDATGDIIARTRKQPPVESPGKAAGTFGYPKRRLLVVNE